MIDSECDLISANERYLQTLQRYQITVDSMIVAPTITLRGLPNESGDIKGKIVMSRIHIGLKYYSRKADS